MSSTEISRNVSLQISQGRWLSWKRCRFTCLEIRFAFLLQYAVVLCSGNLSSFSLSVHRDDSTTLHECKLKWQKVPKKRLPRHARYAFRMSFFLRLGLKRFWFRFILRTWTFTRVVSSCIYKVRKWNGTGWWYYLSKSDLPFHKATFFSCLAIRGLYFFNMSSLYTVQFQYFACDYSSTTLTYSIIISSFRIFHIKHKNIPLTVHYIYKIWH